MCRLFAKTHAGAFDRIISCEMVEHVGHQVRHESTQYKRRGLFERGHHYAFARYQPRSHVFHGLLGMWQHLGEYFAAVERMLKPEGVFVIEVITTLEAFYEDAAKVHTHACAIS